MDTRLYRSRDDAMIGGVCGGLGEYLGIDPTFARLFFVLLTLANGIGALIYFLFWMVIPLEGQRRRTTLGENVRLGSEEIASRTKAVGDDLRGIVRRRHPSGGVVIGLALIIVGVLYLIETLNLPWLRWLDFDVLWPILLIIGGLVLLLRRVRGEE